MGLYQIANNLFDITDGQRPLEQDEKSVKQMMIDKGEWTEEDEIMEDSTDLEQKLEDLEELGADEITEMRKNDISDIIAEQELDYGEERDYSND